MTLPSETGRNDYVGTGALATYAFTFRIFFADELRVITDDTLGNDVELTEGVDYTVALASNGTGTITLTAGVLAADRRLSIQRGIPFTQIISPGQAFNARTTTTALDRIVMEVIRLRNDVERCIKLPLLESGGDAATKLPPVSERAGLGVVFDNAGSVAVGSPSSSTSSSFDTGAGYNVLSEEFGAIGDGASHPLSGPEAAEFNTAFAAYGAQGAYAIVAGNERDWAAIQCAMWKAAVTGEAVYIPPGLYRMGNKTLRLAWTATPITGQPERPLIAGIYGAGHDSTQLAWDNLGNGQVSLELLGESNPYAVRTEIQDFRIYHYNTCNAGAVCLRVGDCKELFSARRVFLEGANGMLLKIASSSTYAQLCTHFVECKFDANYGAQWTQAGGSFFSVYPDSGGALWDNVLFDSCEFGGLVYCRAILASFYNCQFYSNTRRATIYDGCLYAPIGRITARDCYFEDYRVAILLTNGISDNRGALIDGCHFSATVNDVGAPLAKHAVQIIGFGVNKLGMFTITNNHMNFAAYVLGNNGHHQGDSDGVDIKAPGTRIYLAQNVNIYDPYAAVTLDVTGSYLFSFDASDTAASGIGRITTYRIRTLDQCEMAAAYIPRKGAGATAADLWGSSIQNAGATDTWLQGWTSTLYTTGGALLWAGNDMAVEYVPPGKVKRWGVGTAGGAYMEYAIGGLTLVGQNLIAANVKRGAGTPEGSVTGVVGDIYQRTDGGAGTCLYVKESGTGNTGWVAK